MLNDSLLVGFALLVCAILEAQVPFFKTETGLLWIKLIVFFSVGILEVFNGVLFSGNELTKTIVMGYLSNGLMVGGVSSGIFSVGEAAINANKASIAKKKKQVKLIK